MERTPEQRRRGRRAALFIWSGIVVVIIAGLAIYKLTRTKPPSRAQVATLAREALQRSEGYEFFEVLGVEADEVGSCCKRYRVGLSPDEVEGVEARVSFRVRALVDRQIVRIAIVGPDPYVWPRNVQSGKEYTGTVRVVLKREDGWKVAYLARY